MNMAFSPRDVASLRMNLHTLHGQLASTTNPNAMGSLLRQYIKATDKLYLAIKAGMEKGETPILQSAHLAAPFIPGGAIISAAINGGVNPPGSAGG